MIRSEIFNFSGFKPIYYYPLCRYDTNEPQTSTDGAPTVPISWYDINTVDKTQRLELVTTFNDRVKHQ